MKFGTQVDLAFVMIFSYRALSDFSQKKKMAPFLPYFYGNFQFYALFMVILFSNQIFKAIFCLSERFCSKNYILIFFYI